MNGFTPVMLVVEHFCGFYPSGSLGMNGFTPVMLVVENTFVGFTLVVL